jgi:deazaflavin-dependent oxidoreductase (nitroreductase family)
VDARDLPITGTCDLSTIGRRTGKSRRVEIWYVIIDGQIVVTGTPGTRNWLANLRDHPDAILHLREPPRDLPVIAKEVADEAERRRLAEEARCIRPWYADQSYSIDDWVANSPMVVLVPASSSG